MYGRLGRGRRAHAVVIGGLAGLAIGGIAVALGFIGGLQTALDDNATYNSWTYGKQVIRDGLPTLLGWAYQAIDLLVTVLIGCAAGLAAWTFGGTSAGQTPPDSRLANRGLFADNS